MHFLSTKLFNLKLVLRLFMNIVRELASLKLI